MSDRELAGAWSVIVLRSTAAIESECVSAEAAEGAARKILIPIRVEDVRPPLEFRRLQTATLGDIGHGIADSGIADCMSALLALLGPPQNAIASAAGRYASDTLLTSSAPLPATDTTVVVNHEPAEIVTLPAVQSRRSSRVGRGVRMWITGALLNGPLTMNVSFVGKRRANGIGILFLFSL